ncbi:hypothetical protein D3C86_1812430 [compost metagenome]
MPTRRKAHDADFGRINSPFLRLLAHRFNGLLRILQWPHRLILHDTVIRQPVFQHECCYPGPVELLRYPVTFTIYDQHAVTAAWTNDHSGTISRASWRKESCQCRLRNIPHDVILVCFLIFRLFGIGNTARVKWHLRLREQRSR